MTYTVPTIDLSEHLGMGDGITVAVQERFAMPPVVVAALRQAGKGAVLKLLTLMEDEKQFDKLTPEQQLKVIQLVLDRAYGKSETASTSLNLLHKAGQLDGGADKGMGSHLKEIENRMDERSVTYPELTKSHLKGKTSLHNPDATSVSSTAGYNPTKPQEIILPDELPTTVVDLEARMKAKQRSSKRPRRSDQRSSKLAKCRKAS